MAFPGIFKMLFENSGDGPLLRRDVLPLAKAGSLGAVSPDNVTLSVDAAGVIKVKVQATISQTTLTVSDNWTAPYTGYYLIEIQGAGGGSGALYGPGCTLATGGAASGGYRAFVKWYGSGTPAPYTIGAGGTAGVASSAGGGVGIGNGGSGGSTTFDGVTAGGGAGSYGISYPSSAAFNGLYPGLGRIAAAGGQNGHDASYGYFNRANGLFGYLSAGMGGCSAFGTPGAGGSIPTGATDRDQGSAVSGYGAGAGGVASNNYSCNGNVGGDGCVRITFLGV